VLKRRRGCPMHACRGPCGESGSRNRFAKTRAFGARLLEGEGAGEPGQWASSVRTGAERGHGQRGSGQDGGGGTGEVGHEEEEGKEKGCRQVGSAEGMTEKEGNDREKKE
jgi:hypothetical protein